MSERLPPKEMAKKITRLLKKQDPDYGYLKKVFAQVRESLGLKGKITRAKKLPELLTDDEMKCFCEAVREENHRVHTVMIKLLIYTGVRNSELANIQIDDVDVKRERIRIDQGKGKRPLRALSFELQGRIGPIHYEPEGTARSLPLRNSPERQVHYPLDSGDRQPIRKRGRHRETGLSSSLSSPPPNPFGPARYCRLQNATG